MQDISNYQDKNNGIPKKTKEKGCAYKLSFTCINNSNRDVHSQSELLPQSNIKLQSTHINHESKPNAPNIRTRNAFTM